MYNKRIIERRIDDKGLFIVASPRRKAYSNELEQPLKGKGLKKGLSLRFSTKKIRELVVKPPSAVHGETDWNVFFYIKYCIDILLFL